MLKVFAVIVLFCSGLTCAWEQTPETGGCLAKAEFAPTVIENPASKMTFRCERAAPLDVIRATGRQTRVPIGVVLGLEPNALSLPMRSYDLENADAKSALLEAIQGTGYSLRERGNVLQLVAGDLSPRQNDLLTYRYSDFTTGPNSTMVDLGMSLTMWMRAVVDPHTGFGMDILESTNDERFTLEPIRSATTEEIANKIVGLGSKGMWILRMSGLSPGSGSTDQVMIEPYQHYSNRAIVNQ